MPKILDDVSIQNTINQVTRIIENVGI
jgi:hypothetical protein